MLLNFLMLRCHSLAAYFILPFHSCALIFYVEKWFPSFHVADINCTVSTVVLHNTKRTSLIKKICSHCWVSGAILHTVAAVAVINNLFVFSYSSFSDPFMMCSNESSSSPSFTFLSHITQITNLKPAASYVFIVRAENSYGVSMPSPMSSAITTSDNSDKNNVPHGELVAARTFLSGKVSWNCKIASSSSAVDDVVVAAARLG